jgi:hypothetical protein
VRINKIPLIIGVIFENFECLRYSTLYTTHAVNKIDKNT